MPICNYHFTILKFSNLDKGVPKMQIIIDSISRKKLVVIKEDKRSFLLEFPTDADIPELFEVISELKQKLSDAIQKEAAEKENTEKKPSQKTEENIKTSDTVAPK